jgi:hypothetical protein
MPRKNRVFSAVLLRPCYKESASWLGGRRGDQLPLWTTATWVVNFCTVHGQAGYQPTFSCTPTMIPRQFIRSSLQDKAANALPPLTALNGTSAMVDSMLPVFIPYQLTHRTHNSQPTVKPTVTPSNIANTDQASFTFLPPRAAQQSLDVAFS